MASCLKLDRVRLDGQKDASPTATISVMSPGGKRGCKCYMRLDTGADVTSVPWSAVMHLYLPFKKRVNLRLSDGSVRALGTRRAHIEIWDGESRFGLFEPPHGIVVLMDMRFGHLGMDILKHLRIEGYDKEWKISYPGGGQ